MNAIHFLSEGGGGKEEGTFSGETRYCTLFKDMKDMFNHMNQCDHGGG